MGNSNKVCPNCNRKMKQQFIGLQHCKCGMSWKGDIGFFERTPDMIFALERRVVRKSKNSVKTEQFPVIRYKPAAETGAGEPAAYVHEGREYKRIYSMRSP